MPAARLGVFPATHKCDIVEKVTAMVEIEPENMGTVTGVVVKEVADTHCTRG